MTRATKSLMWAAGVVALAATANPAQTPAIERTLEVTVSAVRAGEADRGLCGLDDRGLPAGVSDVVGLWAGDRAAEGVVGPEARDHNSVCRVACVQVPDGWGVDRVSVDARRGRRSGRIDFLPVGTGWREVPGLYEAHVSRWFPARNGRAACVVAKNWRKRRETRFQLAFRLIEKNPAPRSTDVAGQWTFERGATADEPLCRVTLTRDWVEGRGYRLAGCTGEAAYWQRTGDRLVFRRGDGSLAGKFRRTDRGRWEGRGVSRPDRPPSLASHRLSR